MPTPAVTEAASAAATESTTQFLPTDRNYRLTGKMPADSSSKEDKDDSASSDHDQSTDGQDSAGHEADEQHENEPPPENEDDSASSDTKSADTAAASAAANTQKKDQKTKADSDSRWAKLSRENRELREKNARLEGREEGRTPSEPRKQESQTAKEAAERPEPKIDDVDAQGKPKYATLNDYLSDVRKWDRDQVLKQVQETSAKTQREQQQTQFEQTIAREVQKRVEETRKAFPDYDQVMTEAAELKDEHGQEILFYTKGSPLDAFFLDSERGHEVLYAIAKAVDQHKHIFARDARGNYLLNPVRQLRELAKIEATLPEKGKAAASGSSGKDTSAKPVTQAPRPPHQVSGKAAVTKDASEQAVETGDFEAYQRAENAKILAKRKKG